MAIPLVSRKSGIFYGYWIVAATFFSALIFSGCGFYAFSLFVTPIETEFGWSRGQLMTALTIYFLVSGGTAPFVGRLVDRLGARMVMAAGALIAGTSFILLSLVQARWHFYASYTLTGLGMSASGMVPTTAVVSNWFERRRGTAIGIMSAGLGAGGLLLAPLIGGYLIPGFDWRITYRIMAGMVWLLIPIVLLVIRTRPEDLGLHPDGREEPEASSQASTATESSKGLTPLMAVATAAFWLTAISFLTHGFSEVTVLQNQVPYLEGAGFPIATAAGILGGVGLFSTIGKFGFGWLCDRMPVRYVCAIGLGLQLSGTVILMNVGPTTPMAVLWAYATIMGLGVGSWLPSMSMLVSTNFGLASYGAIFGMIGFSQSIGAATGPITAGYMYDTMGTYYWAFILLISSYVVSTLSVLMVRRPSALENRIEARA